MCQLFESCLRPLTFRFLITLGNYRARCREEKRWTASNAITSGALDLVTQNVDVLRLSPGVVIVTSVIPRVCKHVVSFRLSMVPSGQPFVVIEPAVALLVSLRVNSSKTCGLVVP